MSDGNSNTIIVDSPTERTAAGGPHALVVIQTSMPAMLGQSFALEGASVTIGRDAESTITIDDDAASRRHARLFTDDEGWLIEDHGSTNGIHVGRHRVKGRCRLRSGDRIRVGQTIFKFISYQDAEARYLEKLYRRSVSDPLTEVFNKRFLFEALDREASRAHRHERPLSLLMIDIDRFKRINDEHGHPCGDEVLRTLAAVVRERLRAHDILARFGGEEFAVVLPETGLEGAVKLADSVRSLVEEQTFRHEGHSLRATISIGCACLEAGESPAALVARADAELYLAKRAGRNRVSPG